MARIGPDPGYRFANARYAEEQKCGCGRSESPLQRPSTASEVALDAKDARQGSGYVELRVPMIEHAAEAVLQKYG